MQGSAYKNVNIRYNAKGDGMWHMEYPAGSGDWKGRPDFHTIDVGKQANVKITFTIVDSPGVTFRPDEAAISDVALRQGSGKPIPGKNSGELEKIKTKSDGKELEVSDKNQTTFPFDIVYSLHFSEGTPDLDPIIKNGGGGGGGGGSEGIADAGSTIILAAAAVGALIWHHTVVR